MRNNESSAANPYLKDSPSIYSSMAEWDGAIQSGEIPNAKTGVMRSVGAWLVRSEFGLLGS